MRDVVVWVQQFRDRDNLFLQWHDPVTGRRRTKGTGTSDEDDAERQRADLEYELRHDLHAEPAKMTWEDFIEVYLEEKMSGRRARSCSKARTVLASFAALGGPRMLASVDERAISRYAARLHELGRATATVHGNLAHLKAALRWAADQRLILRVPKIAMPRLPKRSLIRTVSDEQFRALLRACPSGLWRLFLWTAWHTGMRRSELLSLVWDADGEWPWVDLERSRIWLPAQYTKADADQWVPIHPDLHRMLTKARSASGWVFPLSPSATEVSRAFTAIAEQASVKAILHDLRRTFGTRYAAKVPAQVLQRLMRHSDIKTTLRYYVDVDNVLDEAILAADKPKKRRSKVT